MKKLKILIVGPTPPPYFGVAQATQIILNSSLAQKHDIYHLDTSDRRKNLNFGKFDFINIYLSLKHIAQLARIVLIDQPEVTYLPVSQGLLGYIRDSIFIFISKIRNEKIVLHLRGAYFKTFYEMSSFITRWWIRTSLGWVDRMVVLGESLRDLFNDILPPDKIRVVPNGVKVEDFYQAGINNLEKDSIQLCFISNLDKTKGYWQILEALKLLLPKYKVRCIFAGAWRNEKEKKEVLTFLESNSLQNAARFIGVIHGNEKKKLLAASDAFVFPTYYKYEGHPWVILEAMAAGLPVITTDHACNAETVIDGETGYIITKKNVSMLVERIERLIKNAQLRRSMGEKGRERIRTVFSEEKFIKGLENVFMELM